MKIFGSLAPVVFTFTLSVLPGALAGEKTPDPIQVLQAVGSEGQGNEAATEAWAAVTGSQDLQLIPQLLEALEDAGPVAKNWISTAVDQLAESADSEKKSELVEVFGSFALDLQRDRFGRELAVSWLDQLEPAIVKTMIAGMVSDPSPALRKRAVQYWIDRADRANESGARSQASLLYRQALTHCRDIEQTLYLKDALEKFDVNVDLIRHFGFLTDWMVVGPFHNNDRAGFATVFPPEEALDLTAEYDGKIGATKWKPFSTKDPLGMVNFNEAYDSLKEVTGYAYTEFYSDSAQSVELRLGCKNAWKIWFNGEYLFGREEYHRNREIDQYIFPVELKPGKNRILVKICQNEQRESWTQEWDFQLRVCDATGTAVIASQPAEF